MDEYNVQPVLHLERNDYLSYQRSDYLSIMPSKNVVPDLVTFVLISMERNGPIVLGRELDVLPGTALARPDSRSPAAGAFDLHPQVKCVLLTACREPTDGCY